MKPSRIIPALQTLIAAGRPAFLTGSPGCGKTSLANQTGALTKRLLYTTRLALIEPVDLRGLPVVENGVTRWLTPADFPKAGGPDAIWFFDEWLQATTSVQNAAGQLLNERRLGDYVLPDNVYVMAASNRAKDRAGTNKMPSHIADRFVHLNVEIDVPDWTRYALANGFATEVVAFIQFRPALLDGFNPSMDVSPTPRSWEYVSQVMAAKPDAQDEFEVVKGIVGEAAAAEFLGFMRIFRQLPSPDAVLMSPDKAEVPTNPATLYALSGALARKITDQNFDRAVTYANRMPPEFSVVMVKSALDRNPALQSTRTFATWVATNPAVQI